ncbi:MAG: phage tail tape measure protein, partial [Providencia sp.]|uniref:phage tail tape measure protein n=1 Tax=Providencia sp. TaxID=589 RepID=UPI003F9E178D
IDIFDDTIYTFGLDEHKQRLSNLKFKKMWEDIEGALSNSFASINEKSKRQIEADQKLKKEYETAEEKHQSKLNKIRNDENASQSAKDEAIQREKVRYQKELDRKTPKGKAYKPDLGTRQDESAQAELTSLQAQLKLLQQHSTATDFISQQRKNLQLEQAKFDVLEEASKSRKLSLDEQSLLKNKESILTNKKKLADLGDQISKQEHFNKLQDQADKYVKQQEARQKAIADSLGKSSLELQRALEIEQLRSAYGGTPQWDTVRSAKQATFDKEDAAKTDWAAGASTAWGDYRDAALDANAQIQSVTSATLNGFSSTLASVLVDGQANFRDFTKSILKMLAEIALKMAVVKGFEAFGFGSVTANANGGVYNTPGLSAYSGQIVSKPTLFPFARGAGLMGEAGPEAILPLRRGANGKLGVVAANTRQAGGDVNQTYQITIQNDGSNGEIGPNAVKQLLNLVEQKTKQVMTKERRDGGSFA